MRIFKHLIILIIAICSIAIEAYSTPLTPAAALQRLESSSAAKVRAADLGYSLAHTVKTCQGEPAVYIFNRANDNGFCIVAADTRAYPLLGYGDRNFSADDMSPAMQWWLDEYARRIESAPDEYDSQLYDAKKITRPAREAIEPLLKTQWDQGQPYNSMCPIIGSERTATGCVATSMAQVMNYFKYPERGEGTITYNAIQSQKRLSLNFALTPFGWDDMLDSYKEGQYTQQQADAVAYLMKACGYSVKMDYGLDASSAFSLLIAKSLTKYFKYDASARYLLRRQYSLSEWEQMIYDNLKDCGPAIYGGSSLSGDGHSFVVDGYDNGYFHINWGWSGVSNGYFLLDALNPYELGIGGGSGGGFNYDQDVVLGIRPDTGNVVEPKPLAICQYGSLSATVDGNNLNFDLQGTEQKMWVNYNPETITVEFGVVIEDTIHDSGFETIATPVSNRQLEIKPGYGTTPALLHPAMDLTELDLEDGTYTVTFATHITDGDDKLWTPVIPDYGCSNYVILKKESGRYSVINSPTPSSVLDFSFDSTFSIDNGIVTAAGDITIYGIDGKTIARYWQTADTSLLAPGIYIIKAGNSSIKYHKTAK